jgi:antitoxin (DNA-binding transcriptional repressor) of toxin-antitoxin stability system
VTNLAVHFKLGRENALAWVTTLDQGRPVAGAAVQVSDCHGKPVARLVKAETASREQIDAAIARIKERREGVTTDGLGWKALRDEGRKY